MLLTNHVLSGALIGTLASRPLPVFAVGVASHFALDALPHWGQWGSRRRFLRVAAADGLVSLAAAGALAAASPADRRLAVVAGMAGAALPDLDKPAIMWLGRSPWGRQPVPRRHPARGAGPGPLRVPGRGRPRGRGAPGPAPGASGRYGRGG